MNIVPLCAIGVGLIITVTSILVKEITKYKLKVEQIRADAMVRAEEVRSRNQFELERLMRQEREAADEQVQGNENASGTEQEQDRTNVSSADQAQDYTNTSSTEQVYDHKNALSAEQAQEYEDISRKQSRVRE